MTKCAHVHGPTLCFECFKAGVERTQARREAYAQRALPFESGSAETVLTPQAIAHRRRMLEFLERAARA